MKTVFHFQSYQKTDLAKTTLKSMIDRLESANYVKRVEDVHDRRKVMIVLTEASKAMKEKYELVSDKMNEIFYKGFSEKEIIDLEKYIERILENLLERK